MCLGGDWFVRKRTKSHVAAFRIQTKEKSDLHLPVSDICADEYLRNSFLQCSSIDRTVEMDTVEEAVLINIGISSG